MPPTSSNHTSHRRSSRRSSSVPKPTESHASQICRRVLECGLLSILFLAPLFMGGRHPVGQLAFVLCVGVTFVATLVYQMLRADRPWTLSGAEALLGAGCGLLLLQLVPWPKGIMGILSPSVAKFLPLWTRENLPWFQFGEWDRVSLMPSATQGALVMFVTYCLLFALVLQYVRDLKDVQKMLRWLACAAMGMTALGLAQFLVSNGKFLWIYAHPMRDTYGAVKGTFINENHFAQFISLGLGPLIWWLHSALKITRTSREKSGFSSTISRDENSLLKLTLAIGLGCVCVAGLMTFSRGGVVVMLLAAGATVTLYAQAQMLSKKAVFALGGVGSVVLIALSIFGADKLTQEMGTLANTHSVKDFLALRFTLWQAMFQASEHFRWLGTGVGSHAEVYPIFFSDYCHVELTHGESGYFQLLEETGVLGLSLMLVGIAICFRWCLFAFRSDSSDSLRACTFAVIASLLASVAHSLIDFVWFIPACMSLTVVHVALACRLAQLARAKTEKIKPHELAISKKTWCMAIPVGVAAITLLLSNRLGPALAAPSWDRYLTISFSTDQTNVPSAEVAQAMLDELEFVLHHDPQHARAHLRYASLCLHRFEQLQRQNDNAMGLAQVREAALASNFPSKNEQDRWLHLAFGDNCDWLRKAAYHARRAAMLCPLQGEAYLFLSELSFLETALPNVKRNYLAQALRVRPYHGGVLASLGGEAAIRGDISQAMRYWKVAFHHDPIQKQKLVESLGPQLPAEFLIDQFDPDLDGLRNIYSYYFVQKRRDDAEFAAKKLVEAIEKQAPQENSAQAAVWWQIAADAYSFLNQKEEALKCAKLSVDHNPNNFHHRQSLSKLYLDCDQVEDAIRELQWCKTRRPDDVAVQTAMNAAIRRRVSMGAATSSRNRETRSK